MKAMTARNSHVLAVAHAVRRALRGSRARLGLLRGLSLASAVGLNLSVANAELPQLCVSGATCGNSASIIDKVTSGISSVVSNATNTTITQNAANATLNWQSFNISSGSSVKFIQPDSSSVALNRIYQSSASQIFGNLNANGRVYLLNQNGVVFGSGSQVNVGGLIASSLKISDSAVANGIAKAAIGTPGNPAFELFAGGTTGNVEVQQGASISTSEGGQVLMFAPNVSNAGTIRTPGGQTILAAGTSIYLYQSNDANLRGMYVEVGGGDGAVTNGISSNASITDPSALVGQIVAERGNITLAGLAVNQLGRVSATTSVSEAGSIRLLARSNSSVSSPDGNVFTVLSGQQGDLRLGGNSRTEVLLSDDGDTTVDSSAQPHSSVQLDANRIVLEQNAKIVAPHGDVTLIARAEAGTAASGFGTDPNSASRIYLAEGATIDVSGASIDKTMESNVVTAELRGDELADSELQRDGALRGATVQIDVRQTGTREDGTTWIGSPIGDLSGWVANVPKNVAERNLTGGTVKIQSQGDAILDQGSVINISGGSINYAGGYVNTSRVVGADGKTYDIAAADPGRIYTGLTDTRTSTVTDRRWGVTKMYSVAGGGGTFENGYVEGKDAGALTVLAQHTILNGDVVAQTQISRYQRNLSSSSIPAISATYTPLYRSYDQLPLFGSLILGQTSGSVSGSNNNPDYALGNVTFTNGAAPQLGASFDPWQSAIPLGFADLSLNSRLFGVNRVGALTLRANGEVSLPSDVTLNLPVGGSLDILAGKVDVFGQIVDHSGSIKIASAPTAQLTDLQGGLDLHSGAVIDVSGVWVNDTSATNPEGPSTAALAIKGGNVTLSANRNSLLLEQGSLVDVSGGARLTAAGKLQAGAAGTISLSNTSDLPNDATFLAVNGDLRGYGFADGGTLSLTAAAFCFADTGVACKEDARSNLLRLAPEWFAGGGFSGYSFASNRGGIEVAPGTQLHLQQRNWIASESALNQGSGTPVSTVASLGLLADVDRQSVDLSLSVAPVLPLSAVYDAASYAAAANLEIGRDASIVTEKQAKISLSSNTRLLVDGTIDAPAGAISLKLASTLNLGNSTDSRLYFADQGIWLGDHAKLLATGTSVLQQNSLNLTAGSVLSGGTIRIDADRGHVLASAGSLLDVSGDAAMLDIKSDAQGHYAKTLIGSAGGLIDIEASEAIVLGGALAGHSGQPGVVAGGTLNMTLNPRDRNDPGQLVDSASRVSLFPNMERVIEVSDQFSPVAFGSSALPNAYQGKATLSTRQVKDGGFDALSLTAKTFDTVEAGVTRMHSGAVNFLGDVNLALDRRLSLDATILSATGHVSLSAPIVSMGHADGTDAGNRVFQENVQSNVGSGVLSVQAKQIDLLGTSVTQNIGQTALRSEGDIRLIGISLTSDDTPGLDIGKFTTAGSLTLQAAQLYPTTLSDFTIAAGTQSTDQLTIEQVGTASNVLSAGGKLTLSAPNVVQAGTLRAPFGSITIDSPNITLAGGSVTSTSGDGLSVPFGETQGGIDWAYVFRGGNSLVYGPGHEVVPAQNIVLDGENVAIASGAVLDVSGGGELLASEFLKGPTGKTDVLAGDNAQGYFAILPANQLAAAAYDPSIYKSSTLDGTKTVHLSGDGDLPAGDYIVLPARYALLPGAYLVKPVSGYQDIVTDEHYALADGSTVVSGYYLNTGTQLRDARTSGFAVLKASEQHKAQYTVTSADDFFMDKASTADTSATRLPRDAGTIALLASDSLVLQGTLKASTQGRGAALDIASNAIRVVSDTDTATPAGVLSVRASELSALGAESILIGGTRSEGDAGVVVDTRATNVSIASGATLTAPEVMLAASDTVAVGDGAVVRASGDGVEARDVTLDGNGAFLRAAMSESVKVNRTSAGSGATGLLQVDTGAELSAVGGAIDLESANESVLNGRLALTGGDLSLTGSRVSVGAVPANTQGWALDTSLIDGLDLRLLSLNSRSAIDWYGDVTMNVKDLALSATAMRGFDDGTVNLNATGDVTLTGATGDVDAVSSNNGRFNLSGNQILFAGGNTDVSGFSTVTLATATEVRAVKTSTLQVDGELHLSTPRVTTASGVGLTLAASGAAQLESGSSHPTLSAVTDLGGSFALKAKSIDVDTHIELPSGVVTLSADDSVQISNNANIDVSGRTTAFGDQSLSSRGGVLSISAAGGNLGIASNAEINISGAGGAKAGDLNLTAANGALSMNGNLHGNAQDENQGGNAHIDAAHLADFATLNQKLNAGGLTGERAIRQRGAGDLVVGNSDAVRGTTVALTADQGDIVINGQIRAHDGDGGRVVLSAGNDVVVNGTIDARASSANERNGRVDLRSQNGGVLVNDTAIIATTSSLAGSGSAADGEVGVRVSQDNLSTVLDADTTNDKVRFAGDWSNTGPVNLEGFKVYTDSDISGTDVTTSGIYYTDASTFAGNAPALLSALANPTLAQLNVLAGIEIQSAGDLTLDSAWDFSDLSSTSPWHFNGQPGVLTLRAGGDLIFNQSLSDGFTGTTAASAFVLTATDKSWSYRLVGGADTASADVMAVRNTRDIVGANGDVVVAAGNAALSSGYKMIRTGTGSINIAAANDVILGNSASMIYTAGIATTGVNYATSTITGKELGGFKYPANGGDISVTAGGDMVGAASNQLVTDWLWRIGNVDNSNASFTRSTAWTVSFANFRQNLGALGGGDVTVKAGGNVTDLSVVTPTIGRQIANDTNNKLASANNLEIIGGGNVSVTAGGDLLGGVYYSGRGRIDLDARGTNVALDALGATGVFDTAATNATLNDAGTVGAGSTGLSPILALGDTQANISARLDATLETAVTPTLLPQGRSQGNQSATSSVFSTYTSASSVTVQSTAGDVAIEAAKNKSLLDQSVTTFSANGSEQEALTLKLLPGTLSLQSLRGDVNLNGAITLMPTGNGHLDLLAYQNVNLSSVLLSDADPALIPGVASPSKGFATNNNTDIAYLVLNSADSGNEQFNAARPVRLDADLSGDLQPSRIIAAQGDVKGNAPMYFGAPVDIYAGRDVLNLDITVQNLTASDVTSINSGRDVTYEVARLFNGQIAPNAQKIVIDGPGQLLLSAGRDISLQNSVGISTRGNLVNPVLDSKGASISAVVGLNGQTPQYAEFAQKYLIDSEAYTTELEAFVAEATGVETNDRADALVRFADLEPKLQAAFLQRILVAELRASAIFAASGDPVKHGDYSRGFAALETLFPGSTATDGSNPYAGDLALYFSRIYTQRGGDITLLAPGGNVNAGLATPPAAFGINKAADQLGIVTQQGGNISIVTNKDLQVNESRVFAIDDSDIVVWSSNGDIDAGRGAKTAISAPSPVITYDRDGLPTVTFSAALSGSGIQTRATTAQHKAGDVVLAAPRGVVNAGDAGIVAGNLTIAATAVLGADNIKVSGVSVGVPVDTGGLGASLAGVAAAASSASNATTTTMSNDDATKQQAAPAAQAALSWLEVFVVGLGEDNCKQDDLECLKRQKNP